MSDYINRTELLKAIDTWDKYGCDADSKLVPYNDNYVPYIHYDDVIKCIKGMPRIKPKKMRIITVEDYNKALEELKSDGINTFDVVILDRLTEILQELVIEIEGETDDTIL